jgi:hypothetical protein
MRKILRFLISDKVYMVLLLIAIPSAIVRGRLIIAFFEIVLLILVANKIFKSKPKLDDKG